MPATDDIAYTFSPRVLARWVRSNLRVEATAEGGHQAEFRFHGSTCGNIEFDLIYHVTLGPVAEGSVIQAAHCTTVGDGHTRQCCWREDAATVEGWMRDESPLQGRPLADVFSWAPGKSASGCLCHNDGRMHKWNAVLQTLHFALHSPSP
jgi:hypothetical protein